MVWNDDIWEEKEAQIEEITAKYCSRFAIENLALTKYENQFIDLCGMIGRYAFARKPGSLKRGSAIDLSSADDLQRASDLYFAFCTRYNKIPNKFSYCNFIWIYDDSFDRWTTGENRGKFFLDSDGYVIRNLLVWKVQHPGEEYVEVVNPLHRSLAEKLGAMSEELAKNAGIGDKNNVGIIAYLNKKHNWSNQNSTESVTVTRELVQRTVLISEVKAAPKLPTINAEE